MKNYEGTCERVKKKLRWTRGGEVLNGEETKNNMIQ